MVINAAKFTKLRKKIERKLIGSYGSSKGLGTDMEINKYPVTTNTRGDHTNQALDSVQQIKGIIINEMGESITVQQSLVYRDDKLILYVPVATIVKDESEEYIYEFVVDGVTYLLDKDKPIGRVCNIPGVVKEITIKPKHKLPN